MAGATQLSGFMLLAFFLGLGLLTSASRPLSNDSSMVKKHEDWMVQYGRTYKDNAEKVMRFEIFKKTVEFIEAHNRLNKGYTLSVNAFADLTDEEFRKTYTGYKRQEPSNSSLKSTSFKYKNFTDVPSSVDWVTAGAVTPIKNQGTCGSCWAFASVATIESLNEITTGNLISLSEQEILDCDVNGEDHGCNGGFADGAYQFVINNGGLTTEDNYPYVGYQENYCNGNDPAAVTISGYENVPNNDESSMQQAVANQPITVVLDASDDGFRYYSGGVFTGPCGTATDHVVTVVGYDTASDGTPYWLIKNSWGTSWGENGYIRLQRDVSDPRGLCGVAMYPAYPTNN
ncbi:hypothetical protein Droror1_Dr00012653 [Drosera rotundifolia]